LESLQLNPEVFDLHVKVALGHLGMFQDAHLAKQADQTVDEEIVKRLGISQKEDADNDDKIQAESENRQGYGGEIDSKQGYGFDDGMKSFNLKATAKSPK
jgi:hypothetical protein